MNPDWLVPDWPAPAGVQAVFTTRCGGQSRAPWDGFNLGDHVGDAAADVAANRQALHTAIGSRPVFLKQVHGTQVLALDEDAPCGQVADACLSLERGVACTVMVADCLPVLLTTEDGRLIGAAHAGWRGLAGVGEVGEPGTVAGHGVLESVLAAFHERLRPTAQSIHAVPAIKIVAWLGPCIGPAAFEVGAEVKAAFVRYQPESAGFFAPVSGNTSSNVSDNVSDKASNKASDKSADKYYADLAGLARLRLQALGVTAIYGNDGSPAWCTVSNPSRFFSHRRDTAVSAGGPVGDGIRATGRMAACIWRV